MDQHTKPTIATSVFIWIMGLIIMFIGALWWTLLAGSFPHEPPAYINPGLLVIVFGFLFILADIGMRRGKKWGFILRNIITAIAFLLLLLALLGPLLQSS